MSRTASGAVIHRNVALIACDTPATLQETFRKLGELEELAVPVGDRHVLIPAARARELLAQLREHGQFPRLVGRFPDEIEAMKEDEETEEGAE